MLVSPGAPAVKRGGRSRYEAIPVNPFVRPTGAAVRIGCVTLHHQAGDHPETAPAGLASLVRGHRAEAQRVIPGAWR